MPPRLSELRDALGGRDPTSMGMHLEAVIERVWRCTCNVESSEIGAVLRCGRSGGIQWEARRVLRLYSSVS